MFVTQVLHSDDCTVSLRTTTTRALTFLQASNKFRYGSIILTNSPPNQALNSLPVAAGRLLTYIDCLIGCAQLDGYSVILLGQSSLGAQSFSVTSLPTLYVSLDTWYTAQWPQFMPVIQAVVIFGLSVHTAYIIRHAYPFRSSSSPWAAATSHIQMYPSLIAVL